MTEPWLAALRADPRPWLLDPGRPAVRQLALRWLDDRPEDDPAVLAARAAAALLPPVAPILDAQDPAGWWVKPGPGYGPKYTGTVWSLIIPEQLGADPADPRIVAGCEYVQVRALVAFGRLTDPRVKDALSWQMRAIIGGAGAPGYHRSGTSGPGFACGINEGLPCGWGAVKALRGLAAIPADQRTQEVQAAVETGVELLLSVDPATARYPAGWGGAISRGWFKLGFPSGYVADILQVGEVLAELGYAWDPRLAGLVQAVLAKQDEHGRWRNEYAYRGKLWWDVDAPGEPSPWVTLRACRFLRAAVG